VCRTGHSSKREPTPNCVQFSGPRGDGPGHKHTLEWSTEGKVALRDHGGTSFRSEFRKERHEAGFGRGLLPRSGLTV
jgi:hypothetical protein